MRAIVLFAIAAALVAVLGVVLCLPASQRHFYARGSGEVATCLCGHDYYESLLADGREKSELADYYASNRYLRERAFSLSVRSIEAGRPDLLPLFLPDVQADLRGWDFGGTLLHAAAFKGDVESARLLAGKYPVLLYTPNSLGDTPLLVAVAVGAFPVQDALVAAMPATRSLPNKEGFLPIDAAILRRDPVEVVCRLVPEPGGYRPGDRARWLWDEPGQAYLDSIKGCMGHGQQAHEGNG